MVCRTEAARARSRINKQPRLPPEKRCLLPFEMAMYSFGLHPVEQEAFRDYIFPLPVGPLGAHDSGERVCVTRNQQMSQFVSNDMPEEGTQSRVSTAPGLEKIDRNLDVIVKNIGTRVEAGPARREPHGIR